MSRSEDLYLSSPEWLQSLMVRVYGHKLYRKRYHGMYSRLLNQVRVSHQWTAEQVYQHQCKRLQTMIHFCAENVPYYQQLFRDLDLTPNDIATIDDLQKLPILDKQTLRDQPEAFVSIQHSKPYVVQHTSGSTGTPLALKTNEETYKLAMALLVDFEERHGVPFGARRATFAGRMLKSPNSMSPPFWRYNSAESQLLCSSYHLNDRTFPHYRKALDTFQPVELIGFPSAISELARLYQETGTVPVFSPKLVVTNSENLLPWQRNLIERVFKCAVKDYYSTAEYVNFAGQEENGFYYPNPLIGVTELDCFDDTPDTGALIMTTLTNYSMPLIRYRIGDVATRSSDTCQFPGAPPLKEIEGRVDEYLETADGRRLGRVSGMFKELPGVREAQIVQHEPGKAIINVVRDDTEQFNRYHLLKNARLRLGDNFNLSIACVDKIPRGKNGKFKFVIKTDNQENGK